MRERIWCRDKIVWHIVWQIWINASDSHTVSVLGICCVWTKQLNIPRTGSENVMLLRALRCSHIKQDVRVGNNLDFILGNFIPTGSARNKWATLKGLEIYTCTSVCREKSWCLAQKERKGRNFRCQRSLLLTVGALMGCLLQLQATVGVHTLGCLPVNAANTVLGLNGGQFNDMWYSVEGIYSTTDQSWDSGDTENGQWQWHEEQEYQEWRVRVISPQSACKIKDETLFFKFNMIQPTAGWWREETRLSYLWGSEMKVLPFLRFLTGGGCRAGSRFSDLAGTVLHAPRWALYATETGRKQLI